MSDRRISALLRASSDGCTEEDRLKRQYDSLTESRRNRTQHLPVSFVLSWALLPAAGAMCGATDSISLPVLAPVGAVSYNALVHFVSEYTVNCLRYSGRSPDTFVYIALTVWIERLCERGRLNRVNGQAAVGPDWNSKRQRMAPIAVAKFWQRDIWARGRHECMTCMDNSHTVTHLTHGSLLFGEQQNPRATISRNSVQHIPPTETVCQNGPNKTGPFLRTSGQNFMVTSCRAPSPNSEILCP